MFTCNQCKAPLQTGMKFCSQCGYRFEQMVPDTQHQSLSPGWTKTSDRQDQQPLSAPQIKTELIKWSWFGEAWQYFCAAPRVWVLSVILPLIPRCIEYSILSTIESFNAIAQERGESFSTAALLLKPPAILAGMISIAVGLIVGTSTVVIANKQVRGEKVKVSDLFHPGPFMWPLIGFCVIASVLAIVGTTIMYVPGLLVIAFVFPAIALVADGIGIGEAITRCIKVLKQDIVGVILFTLAWNLLLVISIIPCGLGLVATIPMVQILMALLYRDVIGKP